MPTCEEEALVVVDSSGSSDGDSNSGMSEVDKSGDEAAELWATEEPGGRSHVGSWRLGVAVVSSPVSYGQDHDHDHCFGVVLV